MLLIVAGSAVLAYGLQRTSRLNRGIRIPFWSTAAHAPRGSVALRLFGLALLTFGHGQTIAVAGRWSLLLVLIPVAALTLLIVRHNHNLAGPHGGRIPADPAGPTGRGA
ncbi:hypothetical protein D6T64_11660 [Cryobacterium melibiosiphilum]|uniref:Uncharacterized protein n=1 Tax=Cryobacterium melibiosiphilum TaxID=995039 RepID=A0A3A5MGR0_9MICO|nr:hypothetical protein D6T64_11660 [Cryobacterium melibiosiphilum]